MTRDDIRLPESRCTRYDAMAHPWHRHPYFVPDGTVSETSTCSYRVSAGQSLRPFRSHASAPVTHSVGLAQWCFVRAAFVYRAICICVIHTPVSPCECSCQSRRACTFAQYSDGVVGRCAVNAAWSWQQLSGDGAELACSRRYNILCRAPDAVRFYDAFWRHQRPPPLQW